MNNKQMMDLMGFLYFSMDKKNKVSDATVIATVAHDIGGIYRNELHFSPRSSGYGKYLPS